MTTKQLTRQERLSLLWDNLGDIWKKFSEDVIYLISEDDRNISPIRMRAHIICNYKVRFGQFMWNSFIDGLYTEKTWPELFYEVDNKRAYVMIFEWLEKERAYVK